MLQYMLYTHQCPARVFRPRPSSRPRVTSLPPPTQPSPRRPNDGAGARPRAARSRRARAFEARACARGWRAARRARKAPQPAARVEHNRRRRRRRRRARARDSRNRARGDRTTTRVLDPARLARDTRAHSPRTHAHGDDGQYAAPGRRRRAAARVSRQYEKSDPCLRALSDARDDDVTAEDVNTYSIAD